METTKAAAITQSQECPVHNNRPLVLLKNDLISVRCCCDFFTRKYISDINNKFIGKNLSEILDDWETDLLMNELQLE